MALGVNFAGALSGGLNSFADRLDKLNVIQRAAIRQRELDEERRAEKEYQRQRQEEADRLAAQERERNEAFNTEYFNRSKRTEEVPLDGEPVPGYPFQNTETEEYYEDLSLGESNALAAKHGLLSPKLVADSFTRQTRAEQGQQGLNIRQQNADTSTDRLKETKRRNLIVEKEAERHHRAMEAISNTRNFIYMRISDGKIKQQEADNLLQQLEFWEMKVEKEKGKIEALAPDNDWEKLSETDRNLVRSYTSTLTDAQKKAHEIGAKLEGKKQPAATPPPVAKDPADALFNAAGMKK